MTLLHTMALVQGLLGVGMTAYGLMAMSGRGPYPKRWVVMGPIVAAASLTLWR
jgi:hypothetical protein